MFETTNQYRSCMELKVNMLLGDFVKKLQDQRILLQNYGEKELWPSTNYKYL
jgi:hypothetical protein